MKTKTATTLLSLATAMVMSAHSANAETVLKLGTVGQLGMPIGDAIEQALIPTLEEVSGGQMRIEPHYRGSLCGEQTCGEQANLAKYLSGEAVWKAADACWISGFASSSVRKPAPQPSPLSSRQATGLKV